MTLDPSKVSPILRFVPPTAILPTEQTRPRRVREVIGQLVMRQAWTHPVCCEQATLAVLDGHHRRAAAVQLGLPVIPILCFDYRRVGLSSWRPDRSPSRDEVLRRALSGCLYPPKTTRHDFGELIVVDINLLDLINSGLMKEK